MRGFAEFETYDTKEFRTTAIAPNRSLCNTMDMVPHLLRYDNSFQRPALVERHSEAECACEDDVHPIFDMEYQLR